MNDLECISDTIMPMPKDDVDVISSIVSKIIDNFDDKDIQINLDDFTDDIKVKFQDLMSNNQYVPKTCYLSFNIKECPHILYSDNNWNEYLPVIEQLLLNERRVTWNADVKFTLLCLETLFKSKNVDITNLDGILVKYYDNPIVYLKNKLSPNQTWYAYGFDPIVAKDRLECIIRNKIYGLKPKKDNQILTTLKNSLKVVITLTIVATVCFSVEFFMAAAAL